MSDYKTPDVYVEEVSTLPPSVAEVSTAIPAFIGYTENDRLKFRPTRITSFLEFITLFGKPNAVKFTVKAYGNVIDDITLVDEQQHKLHYALDHYFKNGGGDCYIVSLGKFASKSVKDFADGIDALKTEDEPTLIIISEAVTLDEKEYYSLCQQALGQCNALKDRFCILDVLENTDLVQKNKSVQAFRDGIGTNNLKYGAAYYPFLNTSLNYFYNESDVTVQTPELALGVFKVVSMVAISDAYKPKAALKIAPADSNISFSISPDTLTITTPSDKSGVEIVDAWNNYTGPLKSNYDIRLNDGDKILIDQDPAEIKLTDQQLSAIYKDQTALYNLVKQALNKYKIVLPPSPAVAGVYASTDRERGVWKAPANVSLNNVISPAVKITSSDQDNLNIDTTGGKSVNAIRGFIGKGTLIWGARTLAGNDNEWRYVNVRRLFNMIEESTKKASYFAVFEPNDATTWLKVKGMIESFLYRLWQQGALAGSAPKAAYYVNIGLGKTMTQLDILEGRMIVEIGVAAVRPAEFIVLKFSHKLQEA